MEKIKIEPTNKTPRIELDPEAGLLKIEGRSIPENSFEFYKPVMAWLDEYAKSPNASTLCTFKFEYFNTSSSKCILDIFRKLEQIHQNGSSVVISWYYDEDDEDMQETGEDYKSIIKVPFKVIPNS
ncbi:MAG: DUF1987 domain-containing protein [Bacteroidia bacterium]|nr:DUF1987 domain-containing protein [Bacteroidia bacterium]MDW8300927.1 DUF1987 domain-containing protein [Bacteroidia bacterium]